MHNENLPIPESIIKLGGSLLGLPDLRSRLKNFLGDFSRSRSMLICGGGGAVDQVRKWDRIYNLGEERSHWLALRALSITARVAEKAVPGLELADSVESIEPLWEAGKIPVFDPFQFIIEIDERASIHCPGAGGSPGTRSPPAWRGSSEPASWSS